MKHILLLLSGLGLVLQVATAEETRAFTIYPVLTSDASALIEVAQSIIGAQGKVVQDKAGGRLMISATPEQHAQIAELFGELNRPTPNVRIEIEISDKTQGSDSGVGVHPSGRVVLTPDDTRYNIDLKARLKNQSSRKTSQTRQILMVQSGREAVLQVGEIAPHLDWFVVQGRHHGWIEAAVRFERAGAFLHFKPTVLGNGSLIKVEVTPELRGLSGGKLQSVPFVEMTTAFTVRPGQTINLGGLNESAEFYKRFLVGVDKGGASRALSIRATPHIVDFDSPSVTPDQNPRPWAGGRKK
ncbi:MAG: type II secretory pathway component GspD/PulD (secretin) [Candidatus Promineifilaceae bacterium]|jgi:type II secretory pathway component GspD/PulD (secretin)